MRKLHLSLALCLLVSACSEGVEVGVAPVAWSGSPVASQAPLHVHSYHQDALARAHEYLETNHLLDRPLSDERVKSQRDTFLQSISQGLWLHGEELMELGQSEQLPRWRAALEGRDLSVAMEAAAVVRQRQQGWVAEHGALAAGPAPGTPAVSAKEWDKQRMEWAPQEMEPPLAVLDADGAVQALLAARASGFDPNTRHVPPEMAQTFNDSMLRVSHGLGVAFAWKDEALVVQSIEPDSPAGRSGLLKEGDVLKELRLSGQSWVNAAPPERVMAMLDEAVGSVDLALERDGTLLRVSVPVQEQAFAFNEDQVRAQVERWGEGEDALDVMRVEMTLFYENGDDGHDAATHVDQALERARSESVDLVVLDLRRARGGSVSVAAATAGLFVKGKPLFSLRLREGRNQVLEDPSAGSAWEGPIQVWVGPQTMSAGEAVAVAVGDQAPDSTIVGWPTFGKGTLQRRVEMDLQAIRAGEPSRLGEIWVTMGELTAPDGTSLQQQGVPLDYQLEGGVEEPWGERALANALPATPGGGDRNPPATVSSGQWLHPGMEDTQALGLWQKVGLAVLGAHSDR